MSLSGRNPWRDDADWTSVYNKRESTRNKSHFGQSGMQPRFRKWKIVVIAAFPAFLCYSTTQGDLVLLKVFKMLVSSGDNERKMRKFSQRFPRQDKQIQAAKCKSVTTLESLPRARRKFNYLIYGRVFLCLTTTQSQGKQWKISYYFYCVYKLSLSDLCFVTLQAP